MTIRTAPPDPADKTRLAIRDRGPRVTEVGTAKRHHHTSRHTTRHRQRQRNSRSDVYVAQSLARQWAKRAGGTRGSVHAIRRVHVPLPDALRAWYALDRKMLQAQGLHAQTSARHAAGHGRGRLAKNASVLSRRRPRSRGRVGNGSEVERVQAKVRGHQARGP